MEEPVVGIIGGMGPDATVELMRRVLDKTPAEDDIDHIHMIVDNNPKVPSRLKALLDGGGENPGPVIAEMAKKLEQAGSDFLVIPCNTAHYYHHYAQEAVSIPVWHLIERSLAYIAARDGAPKRVVLLGSTAVQRIHLFDEFFEKAELTCVYPPEGVQELIMHVIRTVKKGQVDGALMSEYNQAIGTMAEDADVFLIACSELSVLAHRHQQRRPVIDALDILAEQIVTHCKGLCHSRKRPSSKRAVVREEEEKKSA